MYREMKIHGFALDSLAHMPMVILKDFDGDVTVPIWINGIEAISVALEFVRQESLARDSSSRELMPLLLARLDMTIDRVTIDELRDGACSGSVIFLRDDETVRVEVRASEAFVVALKHKLPVLVSDEVIERSSMVALKDGDLARENDERRYVDFLDNLDPALLGKYPM